MSPATWQDLTTRFEAECARVGLDLVHPFDVAAYNAGAPELDRLPPVTEPRPLGLLVGNTRALWPAFTRAVQADPDLARAQNPLDDYVSRQLTRVARATSQAHHLVFSHVTQPRPFPIQRLADTSHFAGLSPSHLAIHPRYGPWFALRAVVVIDVRGPETRADLARPCSGCSAPCLPALERALALSGRAPTSASVHAHAAAWIAIRDACPVGHDSRYGDAQLAYHYGVARLPSVPE